MWWYDMIWYECLWKTFQFSLLLYYFCRHWRKVINMSTASSLAIVQNKKTTVRIPIWPRNLTSERVKYPVTYWSSRKNEPPRVPVGRGNKYQPGNRLWHNTTVLSIEGGPVCSLLFHLGFYRSSSSTSLTATWGASCSAMFHTSSLTFPGKQTWMVPFL